MEPVDAAVTETVHAGCVAIDGHGVLIEGPSRSGKSDLALRLIDRGAALVSDDYTELTAIDGRVTARAPVKIAGKIEVRGVGIVDLPYRAAADVALVVRLDGDEPRMPEAAVRRKLVGIALPAMTINAVAASAPIKVELALHATVLPR